MRISIVIPNFNGAHLIKRNLPSVIDSILAFEKISHKKGEIVVVDDGSTDHSVKVLEEIKKGCDLRKIDFNYFSLEENSGFSSTVNCGVKNSKGEIIILLNSDVRPKENFIEYLLPHFDNESVFAVGCMDESIENGHKIDRGRGVGKWKKGFLVHSAGELDKNDTLWVNGGSGAFRKNMWEKVGGMQEVYNPYYWEDIDMSYRALKAGFETVFERRSIVVHEHETGIIKTTKSEKDINKIVYRNQFFFVWLNITDNRYLLSHFLWLPYHVIAAIFRGDMPFVQGFIMAVFDSGKITQIRQKTQKLFTRNDKEILQRFSL